jgi:outer membrane biosynthesis protein TonB
MGSTRRVNTDDFGPPNSEDLRSRFLAIIDGYLKDKGLDQLIPAENRPYEHRSTEERAEMRDFMGTVKGDGTVTKPTTNDGMFFNNQPADQNPRNISEPPPVDAPPQPQPLGTIVDQPTPQTMAPDDNVHRKEMADKLMAEGYDWKSGRGEEDILNDQKKAKQTQALQTLLGQLQKNHKSEAVRV